MNGRHGVALCEGFVGIAQNYGISQSNKKMDDILDVKALDQDYFDEAESTGIVYGTHHHHVDDEWTCFYIFAWLGRKVSDKDRKKGSAYTRTKRFINCTVRIALTQQLLDEEQFLKEVDGVTIDLFYS
jgi:hypothetical protein